MNVLVTGGMGYLGSLLVPTLLSRGHSVRVLDAGYFGTDSLAPVIDRIDYLQQDLRNLEYDRSLRHSLLDGCDSIIHLAALSNDPSAALDQRLTHDVNLRSTVILAQLALERRAKFIFSSSCSVYGRSGDTVAEDSVTQPLTAYAESKLAAERALEAMRDKRWHPVVLRSGTLFGYSPRMRFDLVINTFSLHALKYGAIDVVGSGEQWRPYIHVRDCARAFVHVLERPGVAYGVYNVAHCNMRVLDVARLFSKMYPRLLVRHGATSGGDERSYRVLTERIRREGFVTRVDVGLGIQEVVEALTAGRIQNPEDARHINVKWLRELLRIGVDEAGTEGFGRSGSAFSFDRGEWCAAREQQLEDQ